MIWGIISKIQASRPPVAFTLGQERAPLRSFWAAADNTSLFVTARNAKHQRLENKVCVWGGRGGEGGRLGSSPI